MAQVHPTAIVDAAAELALSVVIGPYAVIGAGVMGSGSADLDPSDAGTFLVANGGGNANTYLSKLDAAGNFVWGGLFAGNPNVVGAVWPADLAVGADQSLYVTGIYVGQVDFDPGAGFTYKTAVDGANRSGDAYVARITPGGGLGYFVSVGSTTGREDGFGLALDDVVKDLKRAA